MKKKVCLFGIIAFFAATAIFAAAGDSQADFELTAGEGVYITESSDETQQMTSGEVFCTGDETAETILTETDVFIKENELQEASEEMTDAKSEIATDGAICARAGGNFTDGSANGAPKEGALMTKEYIISSGSGEIILHGKNLSNMSAYIYEITYDPEVVSVKNANMVGKSVEVLSEGNGTVVFVSEDRGCSRYWSGIINAVRFEALSEKSSQVTLNVYKKEQN